MDSSKNRAAHFNSFRRKSARARQRLIESLESRTLLSAGDLKVYDAAAEFSTSQNPNDVWSYGYSNKEKSAFNAYTTEGALHIDGIIDPNVGIWSSSADNAPPLVGENTSASPVDDGSILLGAHQLFEHPGIGGQYSHIRFTAPADGNYTMEFKFTGIDHGLGGNRGGTTTDVHLLYNDKSLFDGSINGYGRSAGKTLTLANVAMGDTIDFVVGYGSNHNYGYDSTALSAKITQLPVITSIEGVIGEQTAIATGDSMVITNGNAFAVPSSRGTIALQGTTDTTYSPDVLKRVKWTVQRNKADQQTMAAPRLTPNAANPLEAKVALSSEGSFNVILYYDANHDGNFDAGEQLKVFHLAEVGVVVKDSYVSSSNANFTFSDSGTHTTIRSGMFARGHYAIVEHAVVQVVGGGTNGMIGVKKIHVGWLQNALHDTFKATYQDHSTQTEKLTFGTFPILDATYEVGGISVFGLPPNHGHLKSPGPLRDPLLKNDPEGGQDRLVDTADSPSVVLPDKNGDSPVVSAIGANSFVDFLSAFSDDFNESYASSYSVNWSAIFRYTKVAGKWRNNFSAISDDEDSLGIPLLLGSSGVKTTGPLFINEVEIG